MSKSPDVSSLLKYNKSLVQQVEEQGRLLDDMARQLRTHKEIPIKKSNIDYTALQTVVESGEEEIYYLSAKNEQLANTVKMLSADFEDAKADLAEALSDDSFHRHPANIKLYRENQTLREALIQEQSKSSNMEQQLAIMSPSHDRIRDEPLISETVNGLLEKARRELLWSEREQIKERQQHIAGSRVIAGDITTSCEQVINLIEMSSTRETDEQPIQDTTELLEYLRSPFKSEMTNDIIESQEYLEQLSACVQKLLQESDTLDVLTLKSESNRIIKKIETQDGVSTATICKAIQMLGKGAETATLQFEQQEEEIKENQEMVELLETELSDANETISMMEVELERVTTTLWDENEKTGAERIASNAAELHSRLIDMEQENRMLKSFMSKLQIPGDMMQSLEQLLPDAVLEMTQILQESGDPINDSQPDQLMDS